VTRPWPAVTFVAGVLLVVAGALPARADRSTTVGTATESWYLTAAAAPVTVPGAPAVSPYPEGTLHVGVTAGQEDSRSYLSLDLGSVDVDDIVGGTLVLPIAAADAGTRNLEMAKVRVCRSVDAGDEVRGSTAPAPPFECAISAPAVLDAEAEAFEVDLGPLVGSLEHLALVGQITGNDAAWHVALYASDSEAEGARPITAVLRLRDEPVPPAPPVTPLDSTAFGAAIHPESSIDAVAPNVGLGGGTPVPIVPIPRSPMGSPRDPAPAAEVPATPAVFADEGFKYSVVFGLPLVLLVAVPYFGYALTGPVLPGGQRRRASRALNSS